jgi:hypothetical protein
MAAARPLPENALWTVTIQPGGTVSSAYANMKVNPSDTISFHNLAGFPVNIIFTNALTSITDLAQGATSGGKGGSTPLNLTLNYTIQNYNNSQPTGGPYSVQFGIGPLPISITALDTDPGSVAIPAGGQIAFDADANYTIVWKMGGVVNANLWSPQPGTVSAGQNNAQTALAGGNGNTVTYTISASPETHGGGTVSIGT